MTATERRFQAVTWNRNASDLFACKWLRAPATTDTLALRVEILERVLRGRPLIVRGWVREAIDEKRTSRYAGSFSLRRAVCSRSAVRYGFARKRPEGPRAVLAGWA